MNEKRILLDAVASRLSEREQQFEEVDQQSAAISQQSQDLSFEDIYPDREEEEFSGLADSVEIPPSGTQSTASSNAPARTVGSPSHFATGNNPLARRPRP